ncbi:hypothetical protein HETIRDRAFT_102200 [Heterobasidion irregulare TC 32-1]|uniref:Uncharacterized protein n=1 Tax=Heterobasidion irregulare (strain TC 32-1) TaxID=747525 RepID=W4K5S8_HETIT|nr:uncharacterized protein HETIRDRAFT_102200 [Heterobasidion irregulare TC 32-1]ETW81173.1 hypothetical protein HETIRDRAFT_102200 [Heterobasidion irregulare TC 32-1]
MSRGLLATAGDAQGGVCPCSSQMVSIRHFQSTAREGHMFAFAVSFTDDDPTSRRGFSIGNSHRLHPAVSLAHHRALCSRRRPTRLPLPDTFFAGCSVTTRSGHSTTQITPVPLTDRPQPVHPVLYSLPARQCPPRSPTPHHHHTADTHAHALRDEQMDDGRMTDGIWRDMLDATPSAHCALCACWTRHSGSAGICAAHADGGGPRTPSMASMPAGCIHYPSGDGRYPRVHARGSMGDHD